MNSQDRNGSPEAPFNLGVLIRLVTQWRKFIFLCVFFSGLLSLIIAFLLPVKFKAVASVLPAEKADLFGSLEGISSIAKSFSPAKGLASLRGDAELDRYIAILNSDRVIRKVVEKFDLVHVYNITSYPIERTRKELLDNVEFVSEAQGDLTVTVYDQDPARAAAMANYFVDELNATNSELEAQNAKANRQFIEERYQKNQKELASAEDSLKAFQKRYGVIAMPEQTEATVKAGAELAAKLALQEIELNVEERTHSRDYPAVVTLRMETEELRKKIASMNQEQPAKPGETKFLVPFASIPDLGSEYLRRYRDVEIQYKILQFITPLFEQSKVEEQRSTPSVLVLDHAYPAERKSKPKRLLILLGGLLVGILGSATIVGASYWWSSARENNEPIYGVTRELGEALASDVRGFRTRFPGGKKRQD